MCCTLSEIKDVVTIITLTTGAIVAVLGLSAWKTQLKGNQEYQLAKNILLLTYKYKEALFQLRHPAVWTYEYPTFSAEELKNITFQEKHYREIKYAYQQRWDQVIKIKPLLLEAILETQVIWSMELRNIYQKIFTLEPKVQNAIGRYIENCNPEKKSSFPKSNLKVSDNDLIFDSLEDNDPIRKEFNPLLSKIENILKPKLKL